MQGVVKIRPIKTAEFDSEYTIGYKIAEKVLTDNLSTYEMHCIKRKKSNMRVLKRQKGREIKRNFWTPDYCFIGSLLSQEVSVSLKQISIMLTGDKQKMKAKAVSKNFNKSIPIVDKNYYYHYQVKNINKAVMIYLKGVKFVASVLYHYEYLKRVGDIEEFLVMADILNESGMAGLMSKDVAALMPNYQQCYHFNYLNHEADFVVTSKDRLPSAIRAATEFYENTFNPQAHSAVDYNESAQEEVGNQAKASLPVNEGAELKNPDKKVGSSTTDTDVVTDVVAEITSKSPSDSSEQEVAVLKSETVAEASTVKDVGVASDVVSELPAKQVGWRDVLKSNSRSAKLAGKEIRTPSREDKEEEVISEDYVETGAYLQEIYKTNKGQ